MPIIKIQTPSDWKILKKNNLNTVVDPMVLRCGELFLAGASSSNKADETWQLLNKNIDSLATFFDALILNDKIPVFNFEATFMDKLPGFNDRVLTRINQAEEVLVDVSVNYGVYEDIKKSAIIVLRKFYESEQGEDSRIIAKSLADDILNELSVADYEWTPYLYELEQSLSSEKEKKLARFLLGGLIFTGYAQELEGHHLLQAKRSRLFLAASFNSRSANYEVESLLFEKLANHKKLPSEEFPWRPSFFPYLLSKTQTSEELIKEVVTLRRSQMVKDYKVWLNEAFQDWELHAGKLSEDKKNQIKKIKTRIDLKLRGKGAIPIAKMITTAVKVVTGNFCSALGGIYELAEPAFGWVLPNLKGQQYQKLLTKMILSEKEYGNITARIKQFWKNN